MTDTKLGLVLTTFEKLWSGPKTLINDPRSAGQGLAKLRNWPREFRLGVRDDLKFSRLLRRMFPNPGESSDIGVPRIDFLSDIERDLLLQSGVEPSTIALWFQAWYFASGRLLEVSRTVLRPDSDLPEAVADLQDRVGDHGVVAELASADLVTSQENIEDCINRFKLSLTRNDAREKSGWATRRCDNFPGVFVESRDMGKIHIGDDLVSSIDLGDVYSLAESQKKTLAVSLNSDLDYAELFYESSDGTSQKITVDKSGINTSNKVDFEEPASDVSWLRLMAILLFESLKVSDTFAITHVALTLSEAISRRADGCTYAVANGIGAIATRNLRVGSVFHLQSHITLLRSLIQLSQSICEASENFSCNFKAETQPILGLTCKEAKKELVMPPYTYNYRKRAEKIIEDALKSCPSETKGTYLAGRHPFYVPEQLEAMSERLMDALRDAVERTQLAYRPKAKKLDKVQISGSMWLDRIAKGNLLTSERSKELTYRRRRSDVPQELSSCRETSFYLPMYGRTVVFPNPEDLINVNYQRLQIGTEPDLTSAVSVLVALLLWAGAQDSDAITKAIEADEKGTEEVVQFNSGGLGMELKNALIAKGEGSLKISSLVSCVCHDLFGPMNKDWVVREALSVARCLGVTYTTSSARTAAYLIGIETVRSHRAYSVSAIEADEAVPVSGLYVRRIITARGDIEFLVQDESVSDRYEVTLIPTGAATEDELTDAMMSSKNELPREIVVRIKAGPQRTRDIRGSLYGHLQRVLVE